MRGIRKRPSDEEELRSLTEEQRAELRAQLRQAEADYARGFTEYHMPRSAEASAEGKRVMNEARRTIDYLNRYLETGINPNLEKPVDAVPSVRRWGSPTPITLAQHREQNEDDDL